MPQAGSRPRGRAAAKTAAPPIEIAAFGLLAGLLNDGASFSSQGDRSSRRFLRVARQADGEGGIRTLERGNPRYAISSRARSTAPAPLQAPGSVTAQVACQSP